MQKNHESTPNHWEWSIYLSILLMTLSISYPNLEIWYNNIVPEYLNNIVPNSEFISDIFFILSSYI